MTCAVTVSEKCRSAKYVQVHYSVIRQISLRNQYIADVSNYDTDCGYQINLLIRRNGDKAAVGNLYIPAVIAITEAELSVDLDGKTKVIIDGTRNVIKSVNYSVLVARCNATTNCTTEDVTNHAVDKSPFVLGINLNKTYTGNFLANANISITLENYDRRSCQEDCNVFLVVCATGNETCSMQIVTNSNIENENLDVEMPVTVFYYIIIPPIIIVLFGIFVCIFYMRWINEKDCVEQCYMDTYPDKKEIAIDVKKTVFTKTSLDDFVREEGNASIIEEEHENIPQHLEEFATGYDKKKNRYMDVLPFSSNIVKLSSGNYINASYVKNNKNENAYIATQGPLNDSLSDFWRMIWEENVTTIVMLTNLTENQTKKCTKYWPEKKTTKAYGKIKVYVIQEQIYLHYTVRKFKVSFKDDVKNVQQFHYTTWPDHNLPTSPPNFTKFVNLIRNLQSKPTVVHCSAGIGRTGSFILINLVYEMAIETESFDFATTLQNMRRCRAYMLRDQIQYKLCYCVVNELLSGEKSKISTESLFDNTGDKNELFESILEYINDNDYWLDVFKRTVHPFFYENMKKNRIQTPYKSCFGHFFLQRNANENNSDYINAIQLGDNFFTTQQPMPSTVEDFWRLVAQQNIGLIVSLNRIDSDDKTSTVFWPTSIISPISLLNHLEISLVAIRTHDAFDIVELKLTNIYEKASRLIFLMHFKTWEKQNSPTTSDFLDFYRHFLGYMKKTNIVLACNNGVTNCGVFLAFHRIAQQVELEEQIDVCSVVRSLRFYRDDYVNDLEQLRFIFVMVEKLLLENESYREKINKELGIYSNTMDTSIYENV